MLRLVVTAGFTLIVMLTTTPLCCFSFNTKQTIEPGIFSHQENSLMVSNTGGFAVSTTCGGVLEGSAGEIRYKYGAWYAGNESCVWTLSVTNHSVIRIKIRETYAHDVVTDHFNVGYFNKSNYDQPNSFTWIRLNQTSPQTLEVPGPVALFHFVSNAAISGLGFVMTFEAAGLEQPLVHNYQNYFCNNEKPLIFHYPPGNNEMELEYENNQRTTIVLKTVDSGWNVFIQRVDLEASENCDADAIVAYAYDYPTNAWNEAKRLCGKQAPGEYFVWSRWPSAVETGRTTDPLIITFKSDETGTGHGFQLYF